MKRSFSYILLSFCLLSFHLNADNQHLISVSQFEKILQSQKDVILIDIRTPEEYQEGFISKAVNIDWYNNFEDYIQELDTNKTILFYCKSGGRSEEAAKIFTYKGFRKAFELKGGILAWVNSGRKITAPRKDLNTGISVQQFQKIISSNLLVLVDFNAPWCKPCKVLSPILDTVAAENKTTLLLQKIDIDLNKPLAKSMQVNSLPLLILYQNGKEVWRKNEPISKEKLVAIIKLYLP